MFLLFWPLNWSTKFASSKITNGCILWCNDYLPPWFCTLFKSIIHLAGRYFYMYHMKNSLMYHKQTYFVFLEDCFLNIKYPMPPITATPATTMREIAHGSKTSPSSSPSPPPVPSSVSSGMNSNCLGGEN